MTSALACSRNVHDAGTYGAFQPCPSAIPSQYSEIATYYTANIAPKGYTLSIESISNVATSCSASTPSPQQITAKVSSTTGANDTLLWSPQPDATLLLLPHQLPASVRLSARLAVLQAQGLPIDVFGLGFTGATVVEFRPRPQPRSQWIRTRTSRLTLTWDRDSCGHGHHSFWNVRTQCQRRLYVRCPAVTNVAPATGPPYAGNVVTITGTGFSGFATNDTVSFGGNPATNVVVNSLTSITATVPTSTLTGDGTGAVDVEVTTPAGQSPLNPPGDPVHLRFERAGCQP